MHHYEEAIHMSPEGPEDQHRPWIVRLSVSTVLWSELSIATWPLPSLTWRRMCFLPTPGKVRQHATCLCRTPTFINAVNNGDALFSMSVETSLAKFLHHWNIHFDRFPSFNLFKDSMVDFPFAIHSTPWAIVILFDRYKKRTWGNCRVVAWRLPTKRLVSAKAVSLFGEYNQRHVYNRTVRPLCMPNHRLKSWTALEQRSFIKPVLPQWHGSPIIVIQQNRDTIVFLNEATVRSPYNTTARLGSTSRRNSTAALRQTTPGDRRSRLLFDSSTIIHRWRKIQMSLSMSGRCVGTIDPYIVEWVIHLYNGWDAGSL